MGAHAQALRLWVLAFHQRLALGILLEGDSLDLVLLSGSQRAVCHFAEMMWRRMLRQRQVAKLAEMRQRCFQKALYYLLPLDAADVEFLDVEDVDQQVQEIRNDLRKALGASSRDALAEFQSFFTGGVRAIVEDGLKHCMEELR